MYRMLIRLAKERGVQGFTADVLFSNLGMMKVFRKGSLPVKADLEEGIYHLFIPFYESQIKSEPPSRKLGNDNRNENNPHPLDQVARAAESTN
jgi:hypothetical protein